MSEAEKALVAGILIGEGSVACTKVKKPYGRRIYKYPMVMTGMCDEKAVEKVAEHLHKPVYPSTPESCPRTDENPTGKAYFTRAIGKDALKAMKEIEPYIKGTQLQRKWLKALRECEREG